MEKASWTVKAVYLLTALICIGYYSVHFSGYYWGLSVGCLLLFPAMALYKKVMGRKNCPRTEIVVYAFTLLAYGLGECVSFYYRIPGYDKIMHTLSGTLTVILAWIVFYRLKPGRCVERTDAPLAILFCLLAAMAVAGLWEIGEYVLSLITGMDVQKTATQGIHDTMKDMMVCLMGALLCIPSMLRFYRGKGTLLGGMVRENLPERRETEPKTTREIYKEITPHTQE